jgi:hypothetical protein
MPAGFPRRTFNARERIEHAGHHLGDQRSHLHDASADSGSEQIQFRAKDFGLNRRDLLQRRYR